MLIRLPIRARKQRVFALLAPLLVGVAMLTLAYASKSQMNYSICRFACSGRATGERLRLSMESFASALITTVPPSALFALFVASIVNSRAGPRWHASERVCARGPCVFVQRTHPHTSTRTLSDRFVLLSVRERYQPNSSVTGVLVSSLLFCILLYGRAFVIPPFVADSFSPFSTPILILSASRSRGMRNRG